MLRGGVLQQCDTPQELFHQPANLFVAAFIGSPAMNLVEADVEGGEARFGGYRLALPAGSPLRGQRRRVILGVRPTDFEAAGADRRPGAAADAGHGRRGRAARHRDPPDLRGRRAADLAPRPCAPRSDAEDADDGMLLADDDRSQFTARVDGRFAVRAGDEVTLAVDASALHAFDCESGLALGAGAAPQPAMAVA